MAVSETIQDRLRNALVDAKCTSRDGTVVTDSMARVLASLTAALSDQVAVPKDDSMMKRSHAEAQVITLARELGAVTKQLHIASKEVRRLTRQNRKLSVHRTAVPASTPVRSS